MTEDINNLNLVQNSCNDWDNGVLLNWNLKYMALDDQMPNPRDLARWDCPLDNWYKINFDEASKGNPGKVGCGIFIRNSNGDNMGSLVVLIGHQTNHVAEASAALHGLHYAKNLNMKKIWLERGSLNIINCLNKNDTFLDC